MISLNLLPDVKKNLLKVRRQRNLVLSVSIITIVVSAGLLFLAFSTLVGTGLITASTKSDIENNANKIKQAQKNRQFNKYLTVQNQLKQISGLHDGQQILSRLMPFMTALNPAQPNGVRIKGLVLTSGSDEYSSGGDDVSGSVAVSVDGETKDFASLGVYKNTLENANLIYDTKSELSENKKSESHKEKLFTSVVFTDSSLNAGSASESNVVFTVKMIFNSNAFSRQINDPTIEVPRTVVSDGNLNAPADKNNDNKSEAK